MQLLLPAQQQTRTSYPCNDVIPIAANDIDKDTDKVPEKPNICYIFEIL